MKVVDANIKIRCDMPNCKSMAKYKILNPGFVKNAGLFLCKECLSEMFLAISSITVPKSPNNMLNKKIVKSSKGEINEKLQ